MAEAIYESSPVAEESSEFMKRKRQYEVEGEEVDSESDAESCIFSEYEDIEELSDDSFPDDVSIEFREYCKQRHLSEGFNVPIPPKEAWGCIHPLFEGEIWWPFAEEGAEIAVAHYNDNRAPLDGKLRLVRLETVNRAAVAGSLFYITFEAENVTSKEKKMYQAKLYRRIDAYWQVLLFRKKKHAV